MILDSTKCVLDNNVNLIEASAGTGKTYNIQNLFARLIMEKGFPIESILVVTFTDAATKELKDRIRSILKEISVFFNTGKGDVRIVQLANNGIGDKNLKNFRIIQALRNFDKATIFTIHGFCKKILDNSAFETGMHFNMNLEKHPEELIVEIVEDFYRKNFYHIDELNYQIVKSQDITVSKLVEFVNECTKKHDFKFHPEKDYEFNIEKYKELLERFSDSWNRDEILSLIDQAKISKSKEKYKKESISKQADNVESIINNKIFHDSFKIEKFTPKKFRECLLKNGVIPEHPFFIVCQELINNHEQYAYSIFKKCFRYFQKEYEIRKKKLNIRTFDDLIVELNNNLKINRDLITTIGNDFQAVLIDEFQDTDSDQYSIFKKLFIDQNKLCYLIGDPKQAIYKFRGGDIYTYKKARELVKKNKGNIYTLSKNWRSTLNMVKSVNILFNQIPLGKTFVNDFIEFHDITAREFDFDIDLKSDNSDNYKTLSIFYNDKKMNKEQLTEYCNISTVSEIIEILNNGKYTFGQDKEERRLLPSDIAILVNTHKQAKNILPYLQRFGVPAVIQSTGSVFDTEEARTILQLIRSINEPGRHDVLTGCLTSDLFNISKEKLDSYNNSDDDDIQQEFNEWIEFFKDCNNRWKNGSFIEMFNFLMTEKNIKQSLLSLEYGERKLTNILHIQEVIQHKEIDSNFSISGILTWLSRQLDPDRREKGEDKEIRLETDDEALKIMTVHKSKGLEFPIVFCPFLWTKDSTPFNKSMFFEYHDSNSNLIYDLEKSDTALSITQDEILEENMRFAYVAITRAKYKCYIYWGNYHGSSSLDYIFKSEQLFKEIPESGTIVKNLKQIKTVEFDRISDCATILINKDTSELTDVYRSETDNLKFKNEDEIAFNGDIDTKWGINSFSSISPNYQLRKDNTEFDEPEEESIPDDNSFSIFNFTPGKVTGLCWHEIFEKISFQANKDAIWNICNEKLAQYRFINQNDLDDVSQGKIQIVSKMVDDVLNCQLIENDDIVLSKISEKDRMPELEFCFSLNDILKKAEFEKLLAKYKIKINDNLYGGFMSGFVDLVFRKNDKYYILDWKSNMLGRNFENYSCDNINAGMNKHYYNLQYLIYTVALHKFLAKRIKDYSYEKHFGGVFYIFLRGVNKDIPGSGVYYDLPEKKLIEDLVSIL